MSMLASQIALAFDVPRGAAVPPETAVRGAWIRRDMEEFLKDTPVPRALAVCRVHEAVARSLRDMGTCDLLRCARFAHVEVQHLRTFPGAGSLTELGPAGDTGGGRPAGGGAWMTAATHVVGLPFSAGRLMARAAAGGSRHICVGRRTPSVSRYNVLVFGCRGPGGTERYVVVDPGSQNGIRCTDVAAGAPAFLDTARQWSLAVVPMHDSIYVELGGGAQAQVRVKITPVNSAGSNAAAHRRGSDAPIR
jgi:hypothetical protein